MVHSPVRVLDGLVMVVIVGREVDMCRRKNETGAHRGDQHTTDATVHC